MANTNASPNPDDLIDRELIQKWLYWGMFWLMFTPSIGAFAAGIYVPGLRRTLPYFTFGRVGPCINSCI